METRNILISVKEIYVEKIRQGEKRAELRKSFPVGIEGARVYIYATSPRKRIVGYFCIDKVFRLPVNMLWTVAGSLSSLSREDFFSYFSGRGNGVSIHFDRFVPLSVEVTLEYIKKIYPKFHPPQSYVYLSRDFERTICNGEDAT
ncbi:hypothetical protein [Fundidesulfovibrio butyratiphilus]